MDDFGETLRATVILKGCGFTASVGSSDAMISMMILSGSRQLDVRTRPRRTEQSTVRHQRRQTDVARTGHRHWTR